MGTYESKQKTSEQTMIVATSLSYENQLFALFLFLLWPSMSAVYTVYSFTFSPSPALLCPVLGGSSQINCHALVANRFREAERESLSKWRLHLGVGQCYRNACLALCVHIVCQERTSHRNTALFAGVHTPTTTFSLY